MLPGQQQYYRPAAQPPKRRRHSMPWLGLLLLAVGVLLGLHFVRPHHTSAAQRHGAQPVKQTAPLSAAVSSTLDTTINGVIAASPTVDISATIIDLNTGAVRSYGPNVSYEAASVSKLITAVDYAQMVEHGQQAWATTLEDGNSARTDYHNMVVNSDNTAWQSLNDQLGLDTLDTTAQSIGIADYDLSDNTLTTGDIALLLQKLYAGQLLSPSDTKLLLGYMKIANEATLIPPVVPHGVTVYHKAGLLDDRVHDAAIIDNGVRPIVVVVFTNGHGMYDFPARTSDIQNITKAALTAYGIH